MSRIRLFNFGQLNLKISPFLSNNPEAGKADLLRAVNINTDPNGALNKRPGYTSFLGTPDNNQINTLFSWRQNDDSTLWLYRYSGSVLYYSTGGTGAWMACGNGTFTNGAYLGYTVLDNTLIVGDGTAATRHSIAGGTQNGTNFVNTSGAPLARHFTQYQGRVWAARGTAVSGTNTDMFYSTTGTATDWTTDSSSIRIPGAGRINALFKANDRLVSVKDSGNIFRYDGYNLEDLASDLGPTSAQSVAAVEDYRIFLNRRGIFGYGGGRPEIISNTIQRQVYNDAGSGIVGTVFDNAPGAIYKYNYLLSVGSVTDDITSQTVSNCILRYDYIFNVWTNHSYAHRPTALHAYKDLSGNDQLIFGAASGQCYQLAGTALSDAGSAIESVASGMIHASCPELDKRWNYVWAITNPGCQAKVQVALADTWTKGKLNWIDLKQTSDGVMEAKMPDNSRSKLMFWKLYDRSMQARFTLYGLVIDADIVERK